MTLQRLRTVARVSARALVVAGFAGGIWLLSSAAAHASAPAAAPTLKTQQVLAPALHLLDQVVTPHQSPTRSAAASVIRRSVPLLASQATPAGHARRPGLHNGVASGS